MPSDFLRHSRARRTDSGRAFKEAMPQSLPHICHLTVLNPAIHTRIFYKLAWSQREMGHPVTIIGQSSAAAPYENEGIRIVPTGIFGRLRLTRLLAPLRILQKALRADADIYVLHTPELLWVGGWLKKMKGKQVIYDVHEDYLVNITTTEHYPRRIRGILGRWVRRAELRAVRWLDAVCYAEENYDNLLGVPAEKKFILRNKFTDRAARRPSRIEIPRQPYMLYTGTLYEKGGAFRTLELWAEFNKVEPTHLVMAGMAFVPEMFTRIWHQAESYGLDDRFTLIGGIDYLPYADILRLIEHCEFGLALYDSSLCVRMPTKFYEFMAYGKPLVYTRDTQWDAANSRAFMGFSYAPGDDVPALLARLKNRAAYPPAPLPKDYAWAGEEPELARMMQRMKGMGAAPFVPLG